ncbi:hypothetical protein BBK36DRAFT_1128866 [Trichoderma citrinoviride]|uniref:Mid2 domain-containing protein n=1 Tax=Trichoderma citrinoviride TaxID=58853 RepID=A0A2T4AZR4_9HYPO|nr:hypothetical protein BBK36DRAFT_1128866 [Trichoderma citrinoviride]PTB62553.1 hypothetical protein BBK36DRAFT_1128866 [Trichoderma citrinoviride]
MVLWFRIVAFAGALLGQNVLGGPELRAGMGIPSRAFVSIWTSTITYVRYDGILTTATRIHRISDVDIATMTEASTATSTTTETHTESSSSMTWASSSSSLAAFFTLPVIRVTITPTISPLPTLSTSSTSSTLSTLSTSSTSTAPDAKQTEYHAPSSAPQSTHISAAQIAGIAIGSGALFCLVAALFFFFGRRGRGGGRFAHDGDHRLSMRDVGAGLGVVKTRFGTVWGKGKPDAKQPQQQHIEGPAELPAEPAVELPADIPDTVESLGVIKPGNGSTERRVDGLSICGFQPPVVKELDGASVVSHKPMSPSPDQREQQQQQQRNPQRQSQGVEISPVPDTLGENGGPTLPRYEELDSEARSRLFSWAAPESAYRPDKSWYED